MVRLILAGAYSAIGMPSREAQQHHAARVSQLGGSLRVLVEEQALDRAHVGTVLTNHLRQLPFELHQAGGDGLGAVERDDPVRHVDQPVAGARHDPPAEAASTGVDAERDHELAIPAILPDGKSVGCPPRRDVPR
jgi:hypothetical protein